MKKIVFASNNEGKLNEIREILTGYEILSLKDINCNIDVDEDGETFEENAKKKAKQIYENVKIPCISDDSGLCINTFDGWPGVYTARFLGENTTAKQRNENILYKMRNIEKDRDAQVKCCLAYYDGKRFIVGEGILNGKISKSRRGKNGFGFDEIFEIETGYTLAELSKEEKNKISARKLAAIDLNKKLL